MINVLALGQAAGIISATLGCQATLLSFTAVCRQLDQSKISAGRKQHLFKLLRCLQKRLKAPSPCFLPAEILGCSSYLHTAVFESSVRRLSHTQNSVSGLPSASQALTYTKPRVGTLSSSSRSDTCSSSSAFPTQAKSANFENLKTTLKTLICPYTFQSCF